MDEEVSRRITIYVSLDDRIVAIHIPGHAIVLGLFVVTAKIKHLIFTLRKVRVDAGEVNTVVALCKILYLIGIFQVWAIPHGYEYEPVLPFSTEEKILSGSTFENIREVAYRSQFLGPDDRAHAGQARIKSRLIGDCDPDEWDLPPKPKWMRWRTYNRYLERYVTNSLALEHCKFTVALVTPFTQSNAYADSTRRRG